MSTSGVSFASVQALATATLTTGAGDANYPVDNVTDLIVSTKVARITPAANTISIKMTWAAVQTVQFMALVNHNLTGGSIRFRLFSDTGLVTTIGDSGTVSVWPSGAPVAGFPSIRPYVFVTEQTTVRAAVIDITGSATVLDTAGVEVGRFWAWPGSAPGREIGYDSRVPSVDLVGGASDVPDDWVPRVMNADIPFLALGAAVNTAIDFQAYTSLAKPFIYLDDYDDPATWGRRAMLCRNRDLPPSVGVRYRHDRFQARLIEHKR